ncbi:MAG: vWA domain-containing protein [Methyloligellaceae bacterium]
MKKIVILSSLLMALICFAPQTNAAGRPNAVLILDASSSMWGHIDKVNKILIARNALADSFLKYDGQVNMGLVAYGHRRATSCADVETLQKLQKLDGPTASGIINKVTPKGATPISRALKIAAQQLTGVSGPKNIILIADGLDTCQQDPCSTASALKSIDNSIRIHVIAFDRKNLGKLKALRCLSGLTGGLFRSATSEPRLKLALSQTMTAAMSQNVITGSNTKSKEKNVINLQGWKRVPTGSGGGNRGRVEFDLSGDKPVKRVYNPSNPSAAQRFNAAGQQGVAAGLTPITLTALLNDGGLPIQNNLVWRIFSSKPDKKGKYKLLSTHREASPTAALAPGEYLINSSYGRAFLTKKIAIKLNQPVNEIFVMNAGGLRLESVMANGAPVPHHTVAYTIYSDERDQFGTRQKVISEAKPGLIIRLNAGIYHIVSRYGDANAVVSADVTIEPGKLTEATINHTAAKVTFKLVYARGGEALAGTQWSILTPQGDVVKNSAGALPTHILAAGNYVIMARRSGQIFKQPFQVKPSEVKQIEVIVR